MKRQLLSLAALVAVASVAEPRAAALGETQAPQIARPERGSVAGDYSHVAFGPADLDRGAVSLRAPIDLPAERGAALGDWLPTYGAGAGLSEWGMGWRASTAITRFRVAGDLDYVTDELTGPWGRMSRGSDGFWYPRGLGALVRLQQQGGALVAWLSDGSTWTFGTTVDTAHGTYAWHLTSVQTVTGRKTLFAYDKNASGRLFLRSVDYGGTGDDFQYAVALQYETIPLLFVDYASGQEQVLDRRVKTVIVSAKSAATGSFVERWRYSLQYQNDAFGPAYYLVELDQTFASGESAPPVRYTYRTAADHLAGAAFSHVAAVDPLLQQFGADLLQPTRSTVLDIDNDGRPDLEEASAGTLLRQTDSGFVVESLPPAPAGAWVGCRPAPSTLNPPRHLAELRAADGDTEVVDLESSGFSTDAYLCARDGTSLGHQVLDGDWSLGETTRLVDLDRDFQPDLIRVGFGFYEVRANQSGAATLAFGAPQSGTLSPAFTPTSAWVQDFNGDGLVDLIARDSSTLTVWFGQGQMRFLPQGQTFDLRDSSGTSVANLDDYTFVFLDANRDGLSDVLLSSNGDFYLFVNNGYYFEQQAIPALGALPYDASNPVFVDLSGAGNDALTVTANGQALGLPLDEPGTGLMASADDGRGTVLRFDWTRAPAAPGEFQRHVLLSQLTVQSTGYDTVAHQYAYSGARVHSVGRFLVGFTQVTRVDATATDVQTFVQDDDVAGLPLDSTHLDRLTPDVTTFESRRYDEQTFQGLRWLRPSSLRRGDQLPGGSLTLEERTDWLAFTADFCATRTRTADARGTLTVDTTRADVAAMANSLHCLQASEVRTGAHADARLDFREEDRVARNEVGLVTSATKLGALGPLVVHSVAYNSDWTVASVSSPATGTSRFVWDPKTHLLQQVVAYDGSSMSVGARDPASDRITELDHVHGAASYAEYFRYDGQERLQKRWDNLGQGKEANPDESIAYRYATATSPAAMSVRDLVDAATGSARQSVDVETAGGEPITHARALPGGWAFDAITMRSPARAQVDTLTRPPLANADPSTIDLATLLASAQPVATAHRSSLSVDADTLTRFSASAQRTTQTRLSLSSLARSAIETENGALTRTHSTDAGGRVVGYDDEEGGHFSYRYDTLGRVRVVTLPDGSTHRRDLDDYGRDIAVTRDGLGRVEYTYDATTGLLATARWIGSDGVPMRAARYAYDGAGHKISETDQDLVTGASGGFSFHYDGAGFLIEVSGDGFDKSFDYRPDGRLAHRRTELIGWRTVDTTWSFGESGAVVGHTTVVRAADGSVLSTTQLRDQYDAYGRVATIALDGATLASLGYDANGLLANATFAGGSATFSYEPLTRAASGFRQTTSAWTSDNQWQLDNRGLTDSELVSVGNASATRRYGWSARGFLASSSDTLASFQYEYDALGLSSRIVDSGGERALKRSGNTLDAGASTYTFDALGRTVQRDDLTLGYGPGGQIATAQRGAAQWSFKYDESGRRILKLAGGSAVAAYVDEGYLDAGGLTQPFALAGHTLGVIRNGAFRQVPTDHRGTLLGDESGGARVVSPFGDSSAHPEPSAAIDYVQNGWDADLGIVRMGVRDYDPRIGRFWTADPLFFGSLDKCVDNPVSCNLYGYANGDPLQFVDPSGLDPQKWMTISQGRERTFGDYFKAETWKYDAPRDPDMYVAQDDKKLTWPQRTELALEKAKATINRVLVAASAPYLLARGIATEVGAELSNPLPADGVFSRVMPNKYAVQFANGAGKIAGGDEVFVGAATDMEGFGTVRLAQQRLALYSDKAGTIPRLDGDTLVTFRLREPSMVAIRSPIDTIPARGYGFVQGGRTGGGSREWLINNGTASELGAYDIKLHPLKP